MAIWIAFLIILWVADAIFPNLFVGHHDIKNLAWKISSAILILVGFIDDRTSLKPLVKLVGQAIAAAVFYYIFYPEGFSIAGFPLFFAAGLAQSSILAVGPSIMGSIEGLTPHIPRELIFKFFKLQSCVPFNLLGLIA